MSAAGAAERLRIRVRHKRFAAVGEAPPKLVIENFSLEVEPSGVTALFGPSGCGKSTLLNLVAGLDADFSGEVALPEPARIGFVFQEPRLLPWLTVEDNLKLVLAEDPYADSKVDQWLAEMGLGDVRAVFPTRLSLGMAHDKDVVLIAGKGHETYQEVDGVRKPFSDVVHAQQALAARRSGTRVDGPAPQPMPSNIVPLSRIAPRRDENNSNATELAFLW